MDQENIFAVCDRSGTLAGVEPHHLVNRATNRIDNSMRRLPIYFLIDVSESMVGEQIQHVEDGIATIVKELKTDPNALETVFLSVIVFAGQAKTLVPLQELVQFYPPRIPIGGGTSYGEGLGHLMFEMRRDVMTTTSDRKGDWKPIVFLFTDGVPTDELTENAFQQWKRSWQNGANLVAVSLGEETDLALLHELTENVFHFSKSTAEDYKKFFRWVTASIKMSSASVETSSSGFDLAKLDHSGLEIAPNVKRSLAFFKRASPFTILPARCMNSKRPYLMKYTQLADGEMGKPDHVIAYRLCGTHLLDETYFELCSKSYEAMEVSTDQLVGSPSCPSCHNRFGFCLCTCGKLHCIGGDGEATCPWCGQIGTYSRMTGSTEVGQAQG